jgi:hypothetical protein
MLEIFEKAFSLTRDAAEAVHKLKGLRRRRLLATNLRVCHDSLLEIVKRGAIIVRELQALANDKLDEHSVALFIILPRLQHRLRAQSFAILRLNAAFLHIRDALSVYAPDVAVRIGEIATIKTSAARGHDRSWRISNASVAKTSSRPYGRNA